MSEDRDGDHDFSTLQGRVTWLAAKAGTQKALADRAGVSLRTVSDCADGLTGATLNEIRKLAAAGDVDADWLLTGDGYPYQWFPARKQAAPVALPAPGFTPNQFELLDDQLTTLTAAAVVLIFEVAGIGAGALYLALRACA